jgi:hypothetical protein
VRDSADNEPAALQESRICGRLFDKGHIVHTATQSRHRCEKYHRVSDEAIVVKKFYESRK